MKSKGLYRIYLDNVKLLQDYEYIVNDKHYHYLKNVLRMNVGSYIRTFNGQDGEWLAKIIEVKNKYLKILFESKLRLQEIEPSLWLIFPIIKPSRIGYIFEKATELGVTKFIPVKLKYSISDRINYDKIKSQLMEASEQSERLSVPAIYELTNLDKMLDNWPRNSTLIFCNESHYNKTKVCIGENSETLIESLSKINKTNNIAVIVGPEGGFSQKEIDMIQSYDFVHSVGLGPRTLRVETSVCAILSCIQAIIGDWR